ncbi:hypothetical protein J2793_006898 [Paraburkholderia caledonica]|uniref:Uncharacterized protein n=1 Tax=Paraburkholderia caledonica TaxID=134536 RepID=A0AB73IN43_9BURK|nr:hypothetical protein [Paraburkholderia caledonica]
MDALQPSLTPPVLPDESTIWFSAYGFGWGYCAFALPAQTIRQKLGAGTESPNQLLLAFELGKRTVREAVGSKALPPSGERIMLSASDF